MLRQCVLTAAFVVLSASAFAKSTEIQVTLAAPAKLKEVVMDNVIWHCQGTNCVTRGAAAAVNAHDCRDLAKTVGTVTSYASATAKLDEAGLQKCNGGAK